MTKLELQCQVGYEVMFVGIGGLAEGRFWLGHELSRHYLSVILR